MAREGGIENKDEREIAREGGVRKRMRMSERECGRER